MTKLIQKFGRNESGATAIEYGLIAALVAVAIIGALATMKDSLTNTFGKVANALNGA